MRVERNGLLYLLLHPSAPRWTVVNATGLAAARLCDGQHTPAEIAADIAQRWGQPVERVLQDVKRCLEDLGRAGFLVEPAALTAVARPSLLRHGWRLHLYVTEACNLRCRHCAVVDDAATSPQLSAATVRDLVDQAVAAGAEGIAFGGGEPLLRPDLLDLLAHAAPRVKTILATNATLLDDHLTRILADLGVIVQVSVDGPTAEVHDRVRGPAAFDRAWQGIEQLQQAGMGARLALNVTLMRTNIGRAPEIVALAEQRGVAGLRFAPLQRMGRAAERWAELAPTPSEYAEAYRFLYGQTLRVSETRRVSVAVSPGLLGLELEPPEEGMWCGLGHTLLVDARGDIYPCALFTAPEFRLGNLAKTRLVEALASAKLRELAALCERRREEIEECRACAWKHFCQGGCPGSVWLSHGAWYATDGLCEVRRKMFRRLVFDQASSVECDVVRPQTGERS
jgi:radical SAM protein with 4Fe4S-binding SPASM domain